MFQFFIFPVFFQKQNACDLMVDFPNQNAGIESSFMPCFLFYN